MRVLEGRARAIFERPTKRRRLEIVIGEHLALLPAACSDSDQKSGR